MAFRTLLVSTCFFLLITAGAAGFKVSDAPPTAALQDTVETAVLSAAEAQALGALVPADSTATGVCVLSGEATDERKCEYYFCLERLSCESPARFEDERNGNIAVVCR